MFLVIVSFSLIILWYICFSVGGDCYLSQRNIFVEGIQNKMFNGEKQFTMLKCLNVKGIQNSCLTFLFLNGKINICAVLKHFWQGLWLKYTPKKLLILEVLQKRLDPTQKGAMYWLYDAIIRESSWYILMLVALYHWMRIWQFKRRNALSKWQSLLYCFLKKPLH